MSGDSKLSQAIIIDPANEITFRGPFTDVVTTYLRLKNPTERSISFKVKTTAPKQYCVRPNSGEIPAGGEANVAVMLQPVDNLVSLEQARHKFMVQTLFTPPGVTDHDKMWKDANSADLMYSKLRVLFEQSAGRQESRSTSFDVAASPVAPVSRPSGSDVDAKLRHEIDERKRIESERNALKRDLDDLSRKYTKLLQDQQQQGPADIGMPIIQVILLAITGLLIGLIVGKLF